MTAHRRSSRRIGVVAMTVAGVIASIGLTAAPAYAAGVPTITGLSVAKGSTAGGFNTVISGTNFSTVSELTAANVKFGLVNATTFLVLSDTQIAAKVPAGTGAVDTGIVYVTVTNPTGPSTGNSSKNQFVYRAPITATVPANTLLNPNGGSVINVAIDHTLSSAANLAKENITATVGGAAATIAWSDTTHIKITAPAGTPSATATTVAISHDGIAGTNDAAHAKYAAVITSMTPSSGSKSANTSVTVSGKGFTGATTWLTGTEATVCAITNATTATCTIPPQNVPTLGSFALSFTPAGGVPFGTTAGGAFTYTDVN